MASTPSELLSCMCLSAMNLLVSTRAKQTCNVDASCEKRNPGGRAGGRRRGGRRRGRRRVEQRLLPPKEEGEDEGLGGEAICLRCNREQCICWIETSQGGPGVARLSMKRFYLFFHVFILPFPPFFLFYVMFFWQSGSPVTCEWRIKLIRV